ncbi:MAG: DUF1189 family protein [Candidatus Roizmanbacteria bacterium]|nr:DUF1189 family protein [Candidatus Roizmanbacteria bacterium]
MKNGRLFFKTLLFSFINPFYYAEIIKKPLSFSLSYYLIFQIFFACAATTYIVIRFFLPLRDFVEHLPDHLVRIYPDELIVAINNGQVSTNVSEPYAIPFSSVNPLMSQLEKTSTASGQPDFENFLIIDTHAQTEQLYLYKTWSLLTWDSFLYRWGGRIETIPLTTVEKIELDEDEVRAFSSQLQPFARHMIFILSLASFIGFFVTGIVRILLIFLVSLFLFPVMRLIRLDLGWGKSFQIILHTAPTIQLVLAAAWISGIYYWFPFMSLLLNLAVGILVVLSMRRSIRRNTKSPS